MLWEFSRMHTGYITELKATNSVPVSVDYEPHLLP